MADKKREPQGDGVFIFDEVKVISRLMWNSRSQKIIGLAMNPEEMSSLHDAYQLLNEETAAKQTSYILQFLWRDLTSSFDVVGPYFTSSGPLESKFIMSCILQTLRLFHLYNFHTCALVCDGASSNVSAVKWFSGVNGAYGVKRSGDEHTADKHAVKPWFTNVFDPDRKIFWVICPSHQVNHVDLGIKLHIIIVLITVAEEHDQCTPFIPGQWNQSIRMQWQYVWLGRDLQDVEQGM